MANSTEIRIITIGGSAVFGKLNAHQFSTTQAGDNHVLDFQNDNTLYNAYTSGNLGTNFHCIHTGDV